MEIYRPNATTEDVAFLEALAQFTSAGIDILGAEDRVNVLGLAGAVNYGVHRNGDVTRIDHTGIFYIGRI